LGVVIEIETETETEMETQNENRWGRGGVKKKKIEAGKTIIHQTNQRISA
jgi:hypothetical protein